MSTETAPAPARGRWVAPVVYGVLGVELAVVIWFAATYNALDFRIYMWGGHEVLHDGRLYSELAFGHWFTYSPFAAVVYVPLATLPLALARVLWDLASVAALAYSCVITLKLAGYRPSRLMAAGVTAAAFALDPVYQTLFLGQIDLILLALIITDVWRAAHGKSAGVLVGIAAAIKLTPLIFIAFFLLTRRVKAALIAAGTFGVCGLIGWLIAPNASVRYWEHLSHDTTRVGAPYISNQSPYAAAIRIAEGASHIGAWYVVIPLAFAAIGLTAAALLVRRQGDWLAAATVTGVTGLLVSPISWAHHWVWIIPALVLLVRDRYRIAAAAGYLLFAVSPFWYTPHSGGPREYGFHGLLTLVANCYLIAGLAFGAFMTRRAFTAAKPAAGERSETEAPRPVLDKKLLWSERAVVPQPRTTEHPVLVGGLCVTPEPVDPLRLGTLSSARISQRALFDAVASVPQVTVAAVAARDSSRAEALALRYGLAKAYGSYSELLADPDIDAVYNPLPNSLHAPWTLAAVEAGKHVLCEKPFAGNAEQAARVAEAADASGLVVMEAMHYRYHPLIKRLREVAGELGPVRHIQCWTSFVIGNPDDIRYDHALGGGALMDGGCYAIDFMRLFGEPAVTGALADPVDDGQVDRAMAVRLAFGDGATGWFESAFTRDGEFRADAHVICRDGHVWLTNFIFVHQGRLVATRDGSVVLDEPGGGETTYVWQLRAFAAAIAGASPVPTSAAHAVTTMRLIDDAYRAAGLPPR